MPTGTTTINEAAQYVLAKKNQAHAATEPLNFGFGSLHRVNTWGHLDPPDGLKQTNMIAKYPENSDKIVQQLHGEQ